MGQTQQCPSPSALAALDELVLQAPQSYWGPASDACWLWAINADSWNPIGGSTSEEFKFLLSQLAPDDQAKVLKIPPWRDKKHSLLGRLLSLRACAQALGQPDFSCIEIGRTKGQKPFLKHPLPDGLPNFNFNVSHDGCWVVLASDPLHLVGLDVSAPQRARGDAQDDAYLEDLRMVLTESELSFINRGQSVVARYALFQRIWSAKEAVTKAIGQGLDFGLERIEITLIGKLPAPGFDMGRAIASAVGSLWRWTWASSSDVSMEPSQKNKTGSEESAQPTQRERGHDTETELQNQRGELYEQSSSSADRNTEELRRRNLTHIETSANASPQALGASVCVDMWPRSDWTVMQEELEGGYWMSLALGPVESAIDADGVFSSSLRLPHLGGPMALAKARSKKGSPRGKTAKRTSQEEEAEKEITRVRSHRSLKVMELHELLPEEAAKQFACLRSV